jgi:HEAT repeat protein
LVSKSEAGDVGKWIRALADQAPPFTSLGTPFLTDTEATRSLVNIGASAVPALVHALDHENAKVVMYAAYCLGLIGDRSAIPALRRVKEKYSRREPRTEYDFGVISAVNKAEERLS